jgi:drug/metabolite transporter (DMT)-like permease
VRWEISAQIRKGLNSMASIIFGLIAALAWGVHDFCVRYVSQNTGIFPAFMTVMVTGTLLCLPFTLIYGDWISLTPHTTRLAIYSGLVFGAAGLALYRAFSIGPVRLVAPIISTYPVLSVAWAGFQGSHISVGQWTAVFAIIVGVGAVATLSDTDESNRVKPAAIFWSVFSSAGFAITFALGQAASRNGAELPVILLSHLAGVLSIFVIAFVLRAPLSPNRRQIPLLALMGALDTLALGVVLAAGTTPNPELASVVASVFGLITVLLAWIFLRERMTWPQWSGVLAVFAGIVYLGL